MGVNGSIPASLDTSIIKFNLDTYGYLWPRDAAFAAMALDMAGYYTFTKRFYSLVFRLFGGEGFLFQKYNPSGTWGGSTWHPWTVRSRRSLNIQEDETATVIYAFWHYFQRTRDYDLLREVYDVIARAANFMVNFRDEKLKLPLESYDLWEERLGVHTYTAAQYTPDYLRRATWLRCLVSMRAPVSGRRLPWRFERPLGITYSIGRGGVFYRSVRIDDGKITEVDRTVDASIMGVYIFNVFDVYEPMLESSVKVIMDRLWVKPVGGVSPVMRVIIIKGFPVIIVVFLVIRG